SLRGDLAAGRREPPRIGDPRPPPPGELSYEPRPPRPSRPPRGLGPARDLWAGGPRPRPAARIRGGAPPVLRGDVPRVHAGPPRHLRTGPARLHPRDRGRSAHREDHGGPRRPRA